MRTALELAIVIMLPTGVGYAVLLSVRGFRWIGERRVRVPPVEPAGQLAARLRRLRAQLDATENQVALPAKGLRVRAVRAAYVDVLSQACQRLEVQSPRADGGRVAQAEIYRVEAQLRQHGLDVREPAAL